MRVSFQGTAVKLVLLPLLGVATAWGRSRSTHELSVSELVDLREESVRAYRHAYGSYMKHAYPADELMPLSCKGRHWEHRTRGTIDDALGGYALTMIDSLDMHAVVGDGEAFREAVGTLLRDFESGVLSFDRDVAVSVFEASIRVLGGLLSAHQIATELGGGDRLGPAGWYDGGLLPLAVDLGKRLLPAFDTPLGIPVHRVNLRNGVPKGETRDTCSAAAGTFLVEFGALSRLTGNSTFESAARRAVMALWERRGPLGLVGSGVMGSTGKWGSSAAGIGAGTDSFYEYLQKSAKLFEDSEMEEMFQEAYEGVEEHLVWNGWHVEADMIKGGATNYRVSAVQAFWPAVQATTGDLDAAERTYELLFELWEIHQALPDFYDVYSEKLLHYGRDSPLRPELAESSLALYQATGSARYLRAGADMLRALQRKSRVWCGYASVKDVTTGALDDRMDSYFIAETLKYLFLLFDSSLPPNKRKSIFCTPEQEAEAAEYARISALKNATEAHSNSSVAAVSVTFESEPLKPKGNQIFISSAEGSVTEDAQASQDGSNLSPQPPQCLLWSDTVFSTEGHPFLVSAFGTISDGDHSDNGPIAAKDGSPSKSPSVSHTRPQKKAEATVPVMMAEKESLMDRTITALKLRRRLAAKRDVRFDPHQHFARAVNSGGFIGRPVNAELEVKCHAIRGECSFHDAGPMFLAHMKEAAGEDWVIALIDLCDWVRDTVFNLDQHSGAAEGQSTTYRLHQISTAANLAW